MDKLTEIFGTLDRWRNLPNYQLERRLDVFFTPYLRELISGHVSKLVAQAIIPELPLKRPDNRRSAKVDYVLFAEDASEVYFVELKTDRHSRNRKQDAVLERARRAGFVRVLHDLLEIAGATDEQHKYFHLLSALQAAKQIRIAADVRSCLYPRRRRGFCFGNSCVEVIAAEAPIRVIYIQPRATANCECIDFETIAGHVRRHDDPVSRLLSDALMRWRDDAAALDPELFYA